MTSLDSNLDNLAVFQKILETYRPSQENLNLFNEVKFVLLSAPTAAGRNTLIKNLIMTGHYHYVVSDTTRTPRINNGIPEKDGSEYWFKGEEEFLQGLKNGSYLEAAIIHNQQVSGINVSEFKRTKAAGKIAITDIDIKGCETIVRYCPGAMPIFILPPSYDEWMRRLDSRGHMSTLEKSRRLASARQEISSALEKSYYKFVTNWDLRQTSEFLHNHILSGAFFDDEQLEERQHARALLQELQFN